MTAILVVECQDMYQIVGEAANADEALELARDYEAHVDPEDGDSIPPEYFVLIERNQSGRYCKRTAIKTGTYV